MAGNLADGLPSEGRSQKSAHRIAAEGMPFPWRWNGGTIFPNLEVIWGMSINFAAKLSNEVEPPQISMDTGLIMCSASVRCVECQRQKVFEFIVSAREGDLCARLCPGKQWSYIACWSLCLKN